jgi:hypothetical protein
MIQKERCIVIITLIGAFAAMRAFWSIFGWMLFENSVKPATALYNVLFAAGIWWAWFAARRIPTR